jgi:hypothetical protein
MHAMTCCRTTKTLQTLHLMITNEVWTRTLIGLHRVSQEFRRLHLDPQLVLLSHHLHVLLHLNTQDLTCLSSTHKLIISYTVPQETYTTQEHPLDPAFYTQLADA